MTFKLSILVCSLYKRKDNFLKELLAQFDQQLGEYTEKETVIRKGLLITREYKDVEVLICMDAGDKRGGMKVGPKRNYLKSLMRGQRGTYIDDDDRIDDAYFHYLLSATDQTDVDVINFFVLYNELSSGRQKIVEYGLGLRDQEIKDRFLRTSNHLMCISKEVLDKVNFPNISFGEDAHFARSLKKVAKTEVLIEQILYYYNFSNRTSETQ